MSNRADDESVHESSAFDDSDMSHLKSKDNVSDEKIHNKKLLSSRWNGKSDSQQAGLVNGDGTSGDGSSSLSVAPVSSPGIAEVDQYGVITVGKKLKTSVTKKEEEWKLVANHRNNNKKKKTLTVGETVGTSTVPLKSVYMKKVVIKQRMVPTGRKLP
ncbi:hypothetical protein HHI36_018051 [Cryptolaemus montrouzieri]|uniref:Uncharacterized protein n=1 Tax=Cryptolaemus montrouzieri TaxID=559131 RepID=A0ABD2NYT8_9CUCU